MSEEAASFLTNLISQEPKHAVRTSRFVRIHASTARWTTHALFWGVTQCIVIVTYLRFGTSYQGLKTFDSWSWNKLPIGCPETPVINYHYTLRNVPDESRSQFCGFINIYCTFVHPTPPMPLNFQSRNFTFKF